MPRSLPIAVNARTGNYLRGVLIKYLKTSLGYQITLIAFTLAGCQ
jgi:hypothetical protein